MTVTWANIFQSGVIQFLRAIELHVEEEEGKTGQGFVDFLKVFSRVSGAVVVPPFPFIFSRPFFEVPWNLSRSGRHFDSLAHSQYRSSTEDGIGVPFSFPCVICLL